MGNTPAVARDLRPRDKQAHICALTTKPKDAEVKKRGDAGGRAPHWKAKLRKSRHGGMPVCKSHTRGGGERMVDLSCETLVSKREKDGGGGWLRGVKVDGKPEDPGGGGSRESMRHTW